MVVTARTLFDFVEDPGFDKNVALYKTEAEARRAHVTDVSYDLVMAFRKGDTCDGYIKITFRQVEEKDEDLFIDYHGKGVSRFHVNGKELDPAHHFKDQRLLIPKELV